MGGCCSSAEAPPAPPCDDSPSIVRSSSAFDGHRFGSELSRPGATDPDLSLACALLMELCGTHHLAGADAAGGGVVPPPLVGMLLWAGRSADLHHSFVAETVAFTLPCTTLSSTGDALAAERCTFGLKCFLNVFGKAHQDGVVGFTLRSATPGRSGDGPLVVSVWTTEAAAEGGSPGVAVDFGNRLRLEGLVNASPPTARVLGCRGAGDSWQLLYSSDDTRCAATGERQHGATEALWLIDDVAFRLGFDHYTSRAAGGRVEYGRAGRFLASLGGRCPLGLAGLHPLARAACPHRTKLPKGKMRARGGISPGQGSEL